MKNKIEHLWFEFKDYQKVFDIWNTFSDLEKSERQLVISTHWASSGYWIEGKGTKLTSDDFIYNIETVKDLSNRIEEEIIIANLEGRSPQLVL